jgi:hypothetical protein
MMGIVEATLLIKELDTRYSEWGIIGQLCSRMLKIMCKHVIALREWLSQID